MIEHEDSQGKAAILMEALPYVRQIPGIGLRCKIWGQFYGLARSRCSFTGRPGSSISPLCRYQSRSGSRRRKSRHQGTGNSRGLEATFIDGLRVTDAQTIGVVDEILNDQVNGEVAEFVSSYDCEVRRLPGKEILSCQKLDQQPDLGFVGEISEVHTTPILEALENGFMPIISSTASDAGGQCYNVNADTVAAQVAIALGVRRLVYLSDVFGLLRNPEDPESLLSSLPVNQVDSLKQEGVIAKGMLPKVNSAVEALDSGVNRVHFIDGRLPHSILLEIFTDQGIGTEIVHSTQ